MARIKTMHPCLRNTQAAPPGEGGGRGRGGFGGGGYGGGGYGGGRGRGGECCMIVPCVGQSTIASPLCGTCGLERHAICDC